MKHFTVYILVFLLCRAIPVIAQEKLTSTTDKPESRFSLGVQLGTDIGGAVPFPFKYVPKTFNPYPKLDISLGAKLTFPVTGQWTLGTELTYKSITLDADARVENQRFEDDEYIQYFTGSAKMHMDFTMLEIPVYVKYTFQSNKDRILFGPYFAWVMNSSFVIEPKKGFIGVSGPDVVDAIMPADMDDMDFSSSLDSWDMGIVLGYERLLFPRVELGLRVSCGFKDIFKSSDQYFDYRMLHMRGSVVLSYNLFNIKTPKLLKSTKK